MSAKIVCVLVVVAIFAAPIAWALVKWSKRRAVLSKLRDEESKGEKKVTANDKALVALQFSFASLRTMISGMELTAIKNLVETAEKECERSRAAFEALKGSVGRLIDKKVPTGALASFSADYLRISHDLDSAQGFLLTAKERLEKVRETVGRVQQELIQLALAIDEADALFSAAELRGYKIGKVRTALSRVKAMHREARDTHLANRELGEAKSVCDTAIAELQGVVTALKDLSGLKQRTIEAFAAERAAIAGLNEKVRSAGLDLWLMKTTLPEKELAPIRDFDFAAANKLAQAAAKLTAGEERLARLDIDGADKHLEEARACIGEARDKLAAIEAAKPSPTQRPEPPPYCARPYICR